MAKFAPHLFLVLWEAFIVGVGLTQPEAQWIGWVLIALAVSGFLAYGYWGLRQFHLIALGKEITTSESAILRIGSPRREERTRTKARLVTPMAAFIQAITAGVVIVILGVVVYMVWPSRLEPPSAVTSEPPTTSSDEATKNEQSIRELLLLHDPFIGWAIPPPHHALLTLNLQPLVPYAHQYDVQAVCRAANRITPMWQESRDKYAQSAMFPISANFEIQLSIENLAGLCETHSLECGLLLVDKEAPDSGRTFAATVIIAQEGKFSCHPVDEAM